MNLNASRTVLQNCASPCNGPPPIPGPTPGFHPHLETIHIAVRPSSRSRHRPGGSNLISAHYRGRENALLHHYPKHQFLSPTTMPVFLRGQVQADEDKIPW